MKYEITIHNDKDFEKVLLIYWVGVIELFNQKAVSGDDVWYAIRLFYPTVKIKGYRTPTIINKIADIMSDIESARNIFSQFEPDFYPKYLKQIRSILKKEVSKYRYPTYEEQGDYNEEEIFNISIKVTPTE